MQPSSPPSTAARSPGAQADRARERRPCQAVPSGAARACAEPASSLPPPPGPAPSFPGSRPPALPPARSARLRAAGPRHRPRRRELEAFAAGVRTCAWEDGVRTHSGWAGLGWAGWREGGPREKREGARKRERGMELGKGREGGRERDGREGDGREGSQGREGEGPGGYPGEVARGKDNAPECRECS